MAENVQVRDHVDQLLQAFAANVLAARETDLTGDWRKGNKHVSAYLKAFDELRQFGDEGREALATLMDDPSDDVRSAAACFLLRYQTERALTVLREVAERPLLIGFEAGQCIQRWEEGAWRLDLE